MSKMIQEPTFKVNKPSKINVHIICHLRRNQIKLNSSQHCFLHPYSFACSGPMKSLIQNYKEQVSFCTKEFQNWLSNKYTYWKFKAESEYWLIRISIRQNQSLQPLKTRHFPGCEKPFEELCMLINQALDGKKDSGFLCYEDQKVVLSIKLWLNLKNLSELDGKLCIIFKLILLISKNIFNSIFPEIQNSRKSSETSLIYWQEIKKFISSSLTSSDQIYNLSQSNLQEEEYNIQIIEEFLNKPTRKIIKGGIEKFQNIEAKVCITASIKSSQKVTFDSLIVKRLEQKKQEQEQQEEEQSKQSQILEKQANSLLENRNLLRNINIGQFFLMKVKEKEKEEMEERKQQINQYEQEEEINILPCVLSLQYEKTLEDYAFQTKKEKKKDFFSLLKMFIQVLLAVCYLNKKDIIHSDLKLSNIMLEKKSRKSLYGNIKLIDFGSAIFNSENQIKALGLKSQKQKQALVKERKQKYLTPKQYYSGITSEDIYHKKFDIFALGRILEKLIKFNLQYETDYSKYFKMLTSLVQKCKQKPSRIKISLTDIFEEICNILKTDEKEKEDFLHQFEQDLKKIYIK